MTVMQVLLAALSIIFLMACAGIVLGFVQHGKRKEIESDYDHLKINYQNQILRDTSDRTSKEQKIKELEEELRRTRNAYDNAKDMLDRNTIYLERCASQIRDVRKNLQFNVCDYPDMTSEEAEQMAKDILIDELLKEIRPSIECITSFDAVDHRKVISARIRIANPILNTSYSDMIRRG